MSISQQKIVILEDKRKHSVKRKVKLDPDSDIIMSDLFDREFKTMIHTIRALQKKVHNMHKQIGRVNREKLLETIRSQNECNIKQEFFMGSSVDITN